MDATQAPVMKAVSFGSCYSYMTLSNLRSCFGYKSLGHVYHNRSDQFCEYFIEKSFVIPPLDLIKTYLNPNPDDAVFASGLIRNQYPEFIGRYEFNDEELAHIHPFIDTICKENLDLILLDNFMDIVGRTLRFKEEGSYKDSRLFFNLNNYLNQEYIASKFSFDDFLATADSVRYWIKIYQWLRSKQPLAKIVFLCFFSGSSKTDARRYRRLLEFYVQLKEAVIGSSLIVVPPLDFVDDAMKGSDDWTHVKDSTYRALAGYVHLLSISNLDDAANVRTKLSQFP